MPDMPVVIVAGDIVIDWHLATWPPPNDPSIRQLDNSRSEIRTRLSRTWGGAVVLGALTSELLVGKVTVVRPELDEKGLHSLGPEDDRFGQGQLVWTRLPVTQKDEKSGLQWRRFIELGTRPAGSSPWSIESLKSHKKSALGASPRLLVLYDYGFGFSGSLGREVWEPLLTRAVDSNAEVFLVSRTPFPNAEDPPGLHAELVKRIPGNKLTVQVAVEAYRQGDAVLHLDLTVERAAENVAAAVTRHEESTHLNGDSKARHLIVLGRTLGAMHRFLAKDVERWSVYYDPKVPHSVYEKSWPGAAYGYSVTFAAALVGGFFADATNPDERGTAIFRGLAGIRRLHEMEWGDKTKPEEAPAITFPVKEIVKAVREEPGVPGDYRRTDWTTERPGIFSLPRRLRRGSLFRERDTSGGWRILDTLLEGAKKPLDEILGEVLEQGPGGALRELPVFSIGKDIEIVERMEIECYRSIERVLREYVADRSESSGRTSWRPLAIAVFGPPGSGKSFGIKAIAKEMFGDKFDSRTVNISQFRDASDLVPAFHEIRDIGVGGRIPFVLWDEFDCDLPGRPFGWLSSFLAPMQDGQFQDQAITHEIGRAIFVFAGGRFETFDEFTAQMHRAVPKGPDFASRLAGYLNIAGVNPTPGRGIDPALRFRRAVLLRSLLRKHADTLCEAGGKTLIKDAVERGLLRAFTSVGKYRHGARSMEAIIRTSRLAGMRAYRPNQLPPRDQLHAYVDADEFLGLLHK